MSNCYNGYMVNNNNIFVSDKSYFHSVSIHVSFSLAARGHHCRHQVLVISLSDKSYSHSVSMHASFFLFFL